MQRWRQVEQYTDLPIRLDRARRAAARIVRRLGALDVFDARNRAALERLEEFSPDGLDAVLALAGGPALERCLDMVRTDGRLAMPNRVEPEPKRHRKFRLIKYDANTSSADWDKLSRAVTQTKLRAPIAATYPLSQAARAHARLERGHVVGRIALRIRLH
jgi:NADPH:quinone reductase